MTTKPILIVLLVCRLPAFCRMHRNVPRVSDAGFIADFLLQDADAAKVEHGSKTAKDGFRNEDEIRENSTTGRPTPMLEHGWPR